VPPRQDPCIPSPCGLNSKCQAINDQASCSCLSEMIGSPPNCRPECVSNSDCPNNKACLNRKCLDPCVGSCGSNAQCHVSNHVPICICPDSYTGNPFSNCYILEQSKITLIGFKAQYNIRLVVIIVANHLQSADFHNANHILNFIETPTPKPTPGNPCIPTPCGSNAVCKQNGNQASCECLRDYHGNPFIGCRPECVSNAECSRNLACMNQKCKDPCIGTCGTEAICTVNNHIPTCSCPEGTTGDAFKYCYYEPKVVTPVERDPCHPSPCGTGTVCRKSGSSAVCECIPGYFGNAYERGCFPECTINSDCSLNRACSNYKCVDPCVGVCGYNAKCSTINHSPICSCPYKMVGDPFVECKAAPKEQDPCYPSPCARNGICRVINGIASCQYPECVQNEDCPSSKACFNQRCGDPCPEACGLNALCNVVNHKAVCSCPRGFMGSPFVQCSKIEHEPQPKPECTSNDECSNDQACINERCLNPCTNSPGICGQNAECHVQLHRPLCSCRSGFTGQAQYACYEIGCRSDSECPPTEACVNKECINPCKYTQCGLNAVCKTDYNHKARCHCLDSYRGNPLIRCDRPECTRNDDCPYHLACENEKCVDPCHCAPLAQCNVNNHIPSCRCPTGYTGNPSVSCDVIPLKDDRCRMDADCPSKRACFSGECKNPCHETKPCAANAMCSVVDSLPLRTMVCTCLEGYVGDAEKECVLRKSLPFIKSLELLTFLYKNLNSFKTGFHSLFLSFLIVCSVNSFSCFTSHLNFSLMNLMSLADFLYIIAQGNPFCDHYLTPFFLLIQRLRTCPAANQTANAPTLRRAETEFVLILASMEILARDQHNV